MQHSITDTIATQVLSKPHICSIAHLLYAICCQHYQRQHEASPFRRSQRRSQPRICSKRCCCRCRCCSCSVPAEVVHEPACHVCELVYCPAGNLLHLLHVLLRLQASSNSEVLKVVPLELLCQKNFSTFTAGRRRVCAATSHVSTALMHSKTSNAAVPSIKHCKAATSGGSSTLHSTHVERQPVDQLCS